MATDCEHTKLRCLRTTYVDDKFVPLRRWEPSLPLQARVDPCTLAEHALRLPRDPPCGRNVGEQQTATPVEGI